MPSVTSVYSWMRVLFFHNLRVPYKAADFLTIWATGRFSSRPCYTAPSSQSQADKLNSWLILFQYQFCNSQQRSLAFLLFPWRACLRCLLDSTLRISVRMPSVNFANTAQQRFKVPHFFSAPALASTSQGEAGHILTNMASEAGRPAK
jgi:hypothetical protein